ncbi:ferric reductase family protein [Aspergillus foveolatus]|uniref:ferric reductase family protein n=1 Tax=Aspergillus foveolatus TaxID=210207 RepID=UPI003CCDB10E
MQSDLILLPSPLHLLFIIFYVIGTLVCNVVGIQSLSDAGVRAAHLSLSSLVPMYLSGGYKFGAYLLGVSLRTYSAIHRTIGAMAVLQAIIHVVIAAITHKISTSNSSHVYGILTASIMLSLVLIPLVKKRVYELFLRMHQACALLAVYAIWRHTQALTNKYTRLYLFCYLVIFVASLVWRFACILVRNMAPGRKPTALIVDIQGENVLRVTISPPRPWRIRAGQWIELNVPHVGLFHLLQMHPFTISWWQDDGTGRAASISLLIRQQSGFTKRLAHRIEPSHIYRAWIDGPYGPTTVGAGRASETMGDYGHILMVATGIGIATQLPYIKELLDGHRKKNIRTRRISIIWQLDEEGDWEGAHDWLQALLKEDEGYLLSVTVYDTLHPVLTGNPERFGHHDLIEVYSGVPIWREQLSAEMDKQAGRMLVAGISPTSTVATTP